MTLQFEKLFVSKITPPCRSTGDIYNFEYRYEYHVEEFEKIKAKIAELQGKYESSEDKKNGLIHERETLENDRGKVKDEFQNIQKEVSELRAQVRTAKAESKKVQSSKDVKERSKRENQKLLESVQKVLAETKSRYYVSLFCLRLPKSIIRPKG